MPIELPMTPRSNSETRARGWAIHLLLALFSSGILWGCIPRTRLTVRVVDGRLAATRYVSPKAYEHYLRAKLLLGRGDSGGGIRELERAVALDDSSPYLHCELAAALIATGKTPAARRHVQRAIALKDDFPYALELHADLLHQAGRHRDSERAYLRCIELAPSHPHCYLRYAEMLQQADRSDDARRILRRLVRTSGGKHGREMLASVCLQQLALECAAAQYRHLVADFKDLKSVVVLARIERARGRPDAAVALLQRTHGGTGGTDQIGLELLHVLAQQDAGEPLGLLARRLANSAAPTSARVAVIRLLIRAGHPSLAAEIAETAAHATVELQLLHARALDRMGQLKQAEQLVARLRPSVTTPDAALELSEFLIDRNNPGQAAALLRRIVRKRPNDEVVTADLAQVLILAGEARQAARVLREALARQPKSARLKLALVAALDRLGRWQEAVTLAQQTADTEPENAAAHNAIAYVLANRGRRLEQAERAIRRAMRLEPLEPYVIDSLAWVLRARGRTLEARQTLEIAVRLDGRDPELLAHLARVRSEMGNIAVAIRLLRQALALCRDQVLQTRWKRHLQRLEAARVGTADH